MYICQIYFQLVLIAFRNVKKHDYIGYIYVSLNYKGASIALINIYNVLRLMNNVPLLGFMVLVK